MKVGEIVWAVTKSKEEIPEWLVHGRTVLIPKEGCEGKPEQFRPITCLNTLYKLLTAVLTEVLLAHVNAAGVLPRYQRALLRGHRGCQDALLVDQMVTEDARVRKQGLSVGWIDYTKAYDRVPHGWIRTVLRTIKAPKMVTRTIKKLTPLWVTTFEAATSDQQIEFDVQLGRGLFQGDSLSPLLFCLCITPITSMLLSIVGYKCLHVEEAITHLFYMDDLKLFARDNEALEVMLSIVDEGSQAVGMSLGLRKYGVAHMVKGRRTFVGNLTLDGERQIQEIAEGSTYRYLGISQVFGSETLTIKHSLRRRFLGRLRVIWGSELNA